ncbi:hypothetical protein ACFWE7_13340, partial [Isoptericola sp. NPDC060282]|uniref:KR prefix domain-containing protein n=1 Tax=Isoptericola sp. NPDC060282 TaxID=3347093 RepID=UPI00364F707F
MGTTTVVTGAAPPAVWRAETGADWLLFTDDDPGGVGAALAALVTGLGHRCRTVTPAAAYTRNAEGTAFTLAPDSADDLARREGIPDDWIDAAQRSP